ncbi:hypothetical protein CRENBAI_020523, partial [Crenichthys baileyi]
MPSFDDALYLHICVGLFPRSRLPGAGRQKQTVSREFPAETLSLRRRVEKFSQSEGRTTAPHHRGYSSNVQFGRPNRTSRPTPQLRRLAAVNPLFTVEVSSTSSPRTTFPQHGSRKRLCFGQSK